jgi:hypothetical protein
MKKLAILMVLALELAVCGCGTSSPSTVTSTTTNGNWEAQLTADTGFPASQLNFVTAFTVTDFSGRNVALDITSLGFFNAGACFATGTAVNGTAVSTATGTASFTTNTATDQVTGNLTYTVTSITPSGNVLTLTSNPNGFTGTSSGTTTTTGTLSNGVVLGGWTLTGPCANGVSPAPAGTFIMCQGPLPATYCPFLP